VETFAASLACLLAVASCAERLVRGRDVRWAIVPLGAAIAAWGWLWSLRLPPTPGSALLAITIADLAVVSLGVLGLMRLLGAFDDTSTEGGDEPGDGDDQVPLPPWDPPPPGIQHPLPRHHVPPRNRRRQDHRRRRPTEV
jgi:hypothetical protein